MYLTLVLGTNAVGRRIRRVLVANRGEIALRIMRTARRLGVETVAVYSDADASAQHVKFADRAYRIGEASALSSYLNGSRIVEVAQRAGAQAIHPGYGFLSENFEFASLCERAGLKFVGPSAEAIKAMGQKNRAKEIMIAAGVPTLSGYNGSAQDDEVLRTEAEKIGYPVMIKPVYGGGGKGMRIARSVDDFADALDAARSESAKAFGNTDMIIEKFIDDPRHVEVQIFGDAHGNYVHLWERDCSIQRRHQKIIEEAPAPGLTTETREELGRKAVDAARAVNYEGAGTVEFVMNKQSGEFFFMEMNTRLQVEHPVTEAVTGVDLVEWQFCVADGGKIPLRQEQIPLNGHAVEARVYAEDFDRDTMQFMPTAGKLEYLKFPSCSSFAFADENSVRVDSGVRQGDHVTVHYDPMIAKVIAWGPTRSDAIERLDSALGSTFIGGLCSNVALVRACLSQKHFRSGHVSTGFINAHKSALQNALALPTTQEALCETAIADFLLKLLHTKHHLSRNFVSSALRLFRVNNFARHFVRLDTNSELVVEILDIEQRRYCISCLTDTKADTRKNHTSEAAWTAMLKVENLIVEDHEDTFQETGKNLFNEPLAVTFTLYMRDDFKNGHELWRSWKCKAVQLRNSILVWSGCQQNGSKNGENEIISNGGVLREWPLVRAENRSTDNALESNAALSDGHVDVRAPIPGVMERVLVRVGDHVKKAQALVVLNAMKMEFVIKAPCDCVVESVECEVKDTVSKNAVLLRLESSPSST